MKSLDLFGKLTEVGTKPAKGPVQIFKARHKYREGTKEERCKVCAHCYSKDYAKKYYKCLKMGGGNSSSSDIRVRMVCDLFEKENLDTRL